MLKRIITSFRLFKVSITSLSILLCISLSSCNRLSIESRLSAADNIAMENGFKKDLIEVNGFYLTYYYKITDPVKPYVFYLEGDGLAFINRYTISDNPTPTKPMLLKLATMDHRPNVVYLARPCQYTPINLNPKCMNNKYWTLDRFSEESVHTMDLAIKKITHNKPVNLIGFSGGGAIAVLVGARNKNVSSIITVAGNLDHVEFNDYHHVTHMPNSLNPIDYVDRVKHIPQLHLAGANDTRVPEFIINKFISRSHSKCVKSRTIPGASHESGWDNVWKSIISEQITCN